MRTALVRSLLVVAGVAVTLLGLEAGLRLRPSDDLPLNDPYQFTRLEGVRQFRTPLHSYREVYPLAFERDGYYARTDGAVDYHFDQLGGRWIAPRARDLGGRVALALGDSFTLGFGIRYDDAYLFQAEQALPGRHVVNLAEPGADTRRSLATYLAVADAQPHDLVLYGLHLNDLIHFPTSAVAMSGWRTGTAPGGSRLIGFVRRTLARRAERQAMIAEIVDPAQRDRPLFRDNLAAIEALHREATARGARFVVVLLPILVDLREGTFEPVYAEIRQALAERKIEVIDLSRVLDGRDSDYWILPFDQHPNARANEVFGREVARALAPKPVE